jgi:hypothetical protein
VVVIGDSIAMGTGVLYEETYAARLETALASRFPDRTVEVLDMGLAGLNAPWVVERFERRSLRYDPDLVIYGYTLNDIEGKKYRRTADAGFTGPLASWQSPVYVWRYLGPRLNSLRELLGSPRRSYSFELDENYFRNPEAWQEVLEALGRLAELARQRELCAVMLVHTKLYSLGWLHPFQRHYDLVAEAARERGFQATSSTRIPTPRPMRCCSTPCVTGLQPCPTPAGSGDASLDDGCLKGPGACRIIARCGNAGVGGRLASDLGPGPDLPRRDRCGDHAHLRAVGADRLRAHGCPG